jgi:hypothetical protein
VPVGPMRPPVAVTEVAGPWSQVAAELALVAVDARGFDCDATEVEPQLMASKRNFAYCGRLPTSSSSWEVSSDLQQH